jgi:hypothetical protein
MLTATVLLVVMSAPARADERSLLNSCQALADRAAQSAQNSAAVTKPADEELQRCRQIIREWTLRDSRRSVDEQGRPLR